MNFWNFLGLPSQKDIMGLQQAIAAQSADICRCVVQESQANRNCLIENISSLRLQVKDLESELRQTIQSSSVDNKASIQQIVNSITGIIEATNVDLKLSIEGNGSNQASLLMTELELVRQLSNNISTVTEATHDTQTAIKGLQQTIVAQSADIGCSFDKTIKTNQDFLFEHIDSLRLLLKSVESELSMAILGTGVDNKSGIQQLGFSIVEMIAMTAGELKQCAEENSTAQVSLLKKKLDIALRLSTDLSLLSEATRSVQLAVDGLHDNDKQIMDMTKLVLVNNVIDDLQSVLTNLN